jgi:hypothetical protein
MSLLGMVPLSGCVGTSHTNPSVSAACTISPCISSSEFRYKGDAGHITSERNFRVAKLLARGGVA